jgi:TolA-binding protein
MMARTEQGEQARHYFIEVEKEYKALVKPPLSMEEIMITQLQGMIEQKKRLERVETTQQQLVAEIQEVKAKQSTIATEYYSVSGWYGLHKRPLDLSLSQAVGNKANKLSKSMGILVGKAYDAKYGQVNTYHQDVLQTVAPLSNKTNSTLTLTL